MIKVEIVRIDKSLPLPKYETLGSAAFDIYSRVDVEIPSKSLRIAPSNLIIKVPKGHVLILSARSSLAKKKGLMLANGIGVIDQDYNGPNDEIGVSLYNFSDNSVKIDKGDRIAQGLIMPIEQADWREVDSIAESSRGGFGSTG